MGLYSKVIETFNSWAMRVVEKSSRKLLRHMYTNSYSINICGHRKWSSFNIAIKLVTFLVSFCFVSISSGTPILWVFKNCQRNSCSNAYQLMMEFSQRLMYYVKNAGPFSGYTNNCNNTASFMTDTPFTTVPRHDMNWMTCSSEFHVQLKILKSCIQKYRGNATKLIE